MDFTELWAGGPKYACSEDVFPLTVDSILLADFAPGKHVRRVLDIGCGSGIIGLLIAWSNRATHVTGVDISESAVVCARDNLELNSLGARFKVLCGDIKSVELSDDSFDLAVCNPPYFEKGRGKSGGTAREESSATLRDIMERVAKLLRPGGVFCLVLRTERLAEALAALTELEFSPARLRQVQHTAISAPSMVLLEAWRGVTTELEVMPPLILKDENGCDSGEIKRIYHMD